MFEGARIAVVVPAYNEARLIGRVLDTMPTLVDVVIVVDDASRDATVQVVETRNEPRVCLVRHESNRGVGAAIATGYREALGRADVVAVMAGDAQMDPRDLPAVIGPVVRGEADYVKGVRTRHAEAWRMPRVRRFGTELFAWMTAKTFGIKELSDSQCGYTAIGAGAIRQLDLPGLWPRYGYPNDLLFQLQSRGLSIVQVPVRPVYGREKSGLKARHGLVIAWLIARGAYRMHRARRGR